MTREEKIDVKVNKIHHHQSEIKSLEAGILKLFNFKGFEEDGLEIPFIQEYEDGSISLVDNDGTEMNLNEACEIMNRVGQITPDDFF